MSQSGEGTDRVDSAALGDDGAARVLFERYAERLTSLAERHLSTRFAGRLDGEDIVQSVFRTFFSRSARGEFQIDSSASVWRLLVRITMRKVYGKVRHHRMAKRDVYAERRGTAPFRDREFSETRPEPIEAVVLMEEIETLLEGLPEVHCSILALRLEGYTATEISGRLGISRRSVQRALSLLGERLSRRAEDGDDRTD
ncbi:MAG: hypothetical protein CMJ48_07510 [Planctomycetaceae bacterium]|nr:hypothetical protein [Planctomycetaceae bacterium]